MIAVTRSGTIGKVRIIPKYMAAWTASEHATRFLASDDINAGYLYAWLASDYGYCLMTRCSYGSVILEVAQEMFSSVHIPLPELSIRNEIGDYTFSKPINSGMKLGVMNKKRSQN
jgi:type I restriction enzyme S subunit